MSARKTERLLNLVICLLATRRYLTVDQIREAVPDYRMAESEEAFRRMFERDKEDLRELGVPLQTGHPWVWEDEVGYRIPRERYALPEVELAADEAAAVGLAARLWQSAELASAARAAVLKLEAAGVATEAPVPAGLEPRVAADEPAFRPLWGAVRERQPVEFAYRRPGDTAPTTRRVEPWGLVARHGRWYVVGLDRSRDAARVFRLSRIDGPVARIDRPGTFVVPPHVDLRGVVAAFGAAEPIGEATLRIRAGAAYELRSDAVGSERDGEGWDRVRVRYSDPERLAGQVSGYGDDVVVLEPREVEVAVIARLRAVHDLHRSVTA